MLIVQKVGMNPSDYLYNTVNKFHFSKLIIYFFIIIGDSIIENEEKHYGQASFVRRKESVINIVFVIMLIQENQQLVNGLCKLLN
jgi:hypothetical protein